MGGKNIVICSDGTGNTAVKGRGTNVFKLFEAVDVDPSASPRQLIIYDDGVGTSSFAPLRILSGATGAGLARNVRQLYRALSLCYEAGDQIYLFGFSRGAYTARVVAGIISDCGIVDVKRPQKIKWLGWITPGDRAWLHIVAWRCWRAHRWGYRALLERALASIFRIPGIRHLFEPLFTILGLGITPQRFRNRYATPDTKEGGKVRFIGVWDTVAAVGLPLEELTSFIDTFVYRFSFPDRVLSARISKGCQALAIDEERRSFTPVLWEEPPDGAKEASVCYRTDTFELLSTEQYARAAANSEPMCKEPRIEQVWFAGVHSNVGGGYPKQGLSLVALHWMMSHAERHGLRFSNGARQHVGQQRNHYDKLYDSRRGPMIFYHYRPRDVGALCEQSQAKVRLHISALNRVSEGINDYWPTGFPGHTEVVDDSVGQYPIANRPADFDNRCWQDYQRGTRMPIGARRGASVGIVVVLGYVLYLATIGVHQGWGNFISDGGYKEFLGGLWPISFSGLYNTLIRPVWDDDIARILVPSLIAIAWLISFVGKSTIGRKRTMFWRKVLK